MANALVVTADDRHDFDGLQQPPRSGVASKMALCDEDTSPDLA